ncbi:hypothetical protein Aperf_G00000012212 [Anoplocephala perfoliata]
MEWDEVETSGVFQQFEAFAISKFSELRQRHWKECTAAITDVRKMIGQLRADFEEGISRVNAEKAEIEKELEKCQGMIEGKNLELLGLRRQLRSYNLSKTVCKKCECEVPEVENKLEKEQAGQNNGRKRTRFNMSLTSSSDPPGPAPEVPQGLDAEIHRKPSEKRLCLATANGHVAIEVSKQNPKANTDAPNVLVPETQQESPANESETLTDDITPINGQNDLEIKAEDTAEPPIRSPMSDPPSRRPFGLLAFSPPSQVYDASAAIRRAVNHLDLANYEPSIIAASSQVSKQSRNRSGGNKTHLARHLHKKTCRHYRSPPQREGRTPRRKSGPPLAIDLLSDATGADLTFPSISTFAEATDPKVPVVRDHETALMPPPPLPDGDTVRVTRRTSKQNSPDNFPSLGVSPTAQKNIETQLVENHQNSPKRTSAKTSNTMARPSQSPRRGSNVDQCNDCEEYLRAVGLSPKMIERRMRSTLRHRHLSPKGRNRSSGFGTTTPSSPQDFWSIGNLSSTLPNRKAPQQLTRRPDTGVALRRLRRRRPLEMPKRS